MKVKRIEPKVVTYRLTPERDEEIFSSCMWARYIFDCDNGGLNINSNLGNFSYGWKYKEHEDFIYLLSHIEREKLLNIDDFLYGGGYNEQIDFMHLMSRINGEYLLNKISSPSVFNINKSKESTIENVKKYGIRYMGITDEDQLSEIIFLIRDIDYCASEETFSKEINEIIPTIDDRSIKIIKEYPYGAVVVTELFEKFIQPRIKEDFI